MIHLSVIMPVRNEAEHIADALDRLLAQRYETGKLEILVVDGMSEDATPQIVQEYVQRHPSIVRYFENPKRLSSAARNIGIKNAKGEAVLIVDGHCIIDNDDMLANVSEAFTKTGANCLGRPQPLEMRDATPLQWAIATARRSRLGHHPDSLIYSDQAQCSPASSVGVAYRKSVFEKVGTFDENFDAAEDVEFNTRVDIAGLTHYFEPAIAVRYVPRKTLDGLVKQVGRYGRGRVRLWRKHRHTASLKSFAPAIFFFGLAGVILCWLAVLFVELCLAWTGKPIHHLHLIPAGTFLAAFGIYLAVVVAESVRLVFKQKRWDFFPHLLVVFPTVHMGYAWGILREFFFPRRVS